MLRVIRHRMTLGIIATAVIVAGGSTAFALNSGAAKGSPTSRDQSAEVPTYCNATVPNFTLSQCESTHAQMAAQASQLWPPSGSVMSASSAEAAAQTANGPMVGATTLKVVASYAYRTTYAGAGQLMEATNPFVTPSTPVWVVTQQWSGPLMTRTDDPVGLRPPPANWTPPTVSTVIIDGVSGKPIDSCVGCDIVQASGQPLAVKTISS